MDNLLQSLKNADRIINEANTYFDSANNMEIQKHNAMIKSLKRLKFWAIVLFLVLASLGSTNNYLLSTIFGLLAFSCIPLYFWSKKAIKKMLEEESQQQCGAERAKGQAILEANQAALAFLPSDYWYPVATGFMLKAVQAGRANTLPEAIDKFEEQLHRWKLEEANSEILARQQAQSQQLAEIARDIWWAR